MLAEYISKYYDIIDEPDFARKADHEISLNLIVPSKFNAFPG